MNEVVKKTPAPEERPDLYDDYDGRPEVAPEQKAKESAYWGRIFAGRKKSDGTAECLQA